MIGRAELPRADFAVLADAAGRAAGGYGARMASPVNDSLRGSFDADAALYDRVRPGYPPQLFDDLAELAGVGPGCRLLEVGAGTAKATLPLAERGCRIVAVELGANMAAVAARNLTGFPDVEVVVSAFETWPLPAERFDIVLAATAWHWLDPALRVAKVADALHPGGALAVVETHHIAGGTTDFFADVQDCYDRWAPASTQPGFRLPTANEVPFHAADTGTSGRFAPAVFRRCEWELTYPTAGYLDVLMTYSNHRTLPETARTGLLGCTGNLIDKRYGGQITKRYLTQLWVTRRAS